jgi:hypothetical protein
MVRTQIDNDYQEVNTNRLVVNDYFEINGTEVTATASELNGIVSTPTDATITVGTEADNSINVAVQLTDANGDNVAAIHHLLVYLSDQDDGTDVSAGAPDADVAIGTDGVILLEYTTDLVFQVQTDATGAFDFDIGDTTGTPTWYLVVVLPNGQQVVSDAITFA